MARSLLASRALGVTVVVLLLLAAGREATVPEASSAPYLTEPREWVVAVLATLLAVRIIAHVPTNPVGWLFLGLGVAAAVTVVAATWEAPAWVVWVRVLTWWPPTHCSSCSRSCSPAVGPGRAGPRPSW